VAEGRSREAAWGVVRAAWEEQLQSDDAHGLGMFGEQEIANLFDLFWDAQFADDRSRIQSEVETFIDLILNAHMSDAD